MPTKAVVLAAAVGGSPFVPLRSILTQKRRVVWHVHSY